jgi:hypothetical protein
MKTTIYYFLMFNFFVHGSPFIIFDFSVLIMLADYFYSPYFYLVFRYQMITACIGTGNSTFMTHTSGLHKLIYLIEVNVIVIAYSKVA